MPRSRLLASGVARILAVVTGLALALAGCGGDAAPAPASGPTPGPDALTVVATTTVFADLVRQVGGTRVDVTSLVPKGGEVHTFDPRPADVQRIAEAQLIVANGLGLDDWLTTMADRAGTDAPIVRLAEDLPGVPYIAGEGGEGAPNPHLWLDVAYAEKYVDGIETALSQVDPDGAVSFHAGADAYRERLAALDDEARTRMATIPEANRTVVSFHDSFAYFAAAYGLTIAGTIVDAPGQDPSAGEIARLVSTMRDSGVKAILGESQFNPDLAETIAAETGATVVADLYTGSVGDPPADTYEGMIRHDLDRIVEVLGDT